MLLSPDSPEGEPVTDQAVTQPGVVTHRAAPNPPPAAATVLTGTRSERETSLQAELEAERGSHAKTAKEKKDREVRISELEDELRRLKSPPAKADRTALEEFFED